jgi:EAL domain-containing protein (putative c-di-GMP-specific phosphodiesterase class I)
VQPTREGAKPYHEILLGLRDDDGEAIPAADFLRAVEYYEQLAALDRWVIRNALRWMAANRRVVRDVAGFTIKLTERSVADDHLMEYLLEQLTDTAVPPGKICLEINAADAVAHADQVGRLVRTLQEFGCRFSLSKFSGGEGAHERLGTIPVDYLKLDGRFVRGMLDDPNDLAVVQSATELAHASGVRTLAEFVESEEALARLTEMGVDYVQGLEVEAPRYLTDLGPEPISGGGPDPSSTDFSALLGEDPT